MFEKRKEYFQNKLSIFKEKSEKLVSKSYINSMVHIEELEKRNEKQRSEIISSFLLKISAVPPTEIR